MKKTKQKYIVYAKEWHTENDSTGEVIIDREYIVGETWAVSERQAINNIKFREEIYDGIIDEIGYDDIVGRTLYAKVA